MSIQPILCKICQSCTPEVLQRIRKQDPLAPEIRKPDIIVGQSEAQRIGAEIVLLLQHIERAAKIEQANGRDGVKAHLQTFAHIANQAQELSILLASRCFSLPEDMRPPHELARAKFHAITRKVKLSDQELEAITQTMPPNRGDLRDRYEVLMTLQDLRDRYEEIGKYAPTPAVVETTSQSAD